ncbi:MAG: HTTM domain-containing protein [Polyangiaceae bacterium]
MKREFSRAVRLGAARFDGCFAGAVGSWVYDALRVGLALLFVVRHADWLRPWLDLEHHRSVYGLMFYDSQPTPPLLRSPWLLGVAFGTSATRALVLLRTLLSFTLLLGVRARLSAALLGGVSLLLLAADRYRYFHHLFLLYVALSWLSLAPIGQRFTLLGALRWVRHRALGEVLTRRVTTASPAWPLQLLRALTLSVYAAAGVSKLNENWLQGNALRELEFVGVLTGGAWHLLRNALGYSGVAWAACAFELGVCLLLCLRVTRRVAVLSAWGFHASISACMPVYSFGAQMALLLLTFVGERTLVLESTETS